MIQRRDLSYLFNERRPIYIKIVEREDGNDYKKDELAGEFRNALKNYNREIFNCDSNTLKIVS